MTTRYGITEFPDVRETCYILQWFTSQLTLKSQTLLGLIDGVTCEHCMFKDCVYSHQLDRVFRRKLLKAVV